MLGKIRDLAEKPPGSIPKNLQTIVLVGIGLLILLSGLFSHPNQATRGKDDVPNALSATGADLNRIKQAQKDLADKMNTLDVQALGAGTTRPSPPPAHSTPHQLLEDPAPTVTSVRPVLVETDAQHRENAAPYAPIVVYKEPGHSEPTLERKSNEAPPVETPTAQRSVPRSPGDAAKTSTPEHTESGKWERPQEGDLFRLYEGTFIEGALVNRLDGTFTGPVICEVTAPVFSHDQHAELIPKGARFIGETKSVELDGQRRLAVTFHRLILPNGYSIDLENVKGLSEAGETGLKDQVDNHYLQRFFTSGVIGLFAGLSLRGTQAGLITDAGDAYRQGVASSLGNSATGMLNKSMNILPTVTIREGHVMRVILNRDLLLPQYRS